MASPSIESKLMDNFISSTLPDVTSMTACLDEFLTPMLFYVDAVDSAFKLVHLDPTTGQNVAPINLSTLLGFTGTATHIKAVQSPDQYITLALVSTDSTSTISQLHIVAGALPKDLKENFQSKILQPQGPATSIQIEDVIMTPTTSLADPPQIGVITTQADEQAQSMNLIIADLDKGTWAWDTKFKIPGNPNLFLDNAFAYVGNDPAVFVLTSDVVRGVTEYTLNHYTYDSRLGLHTTQVTLPAGVTDTTRLAVVAREDTTHDLLVLGNGLHHYLAADLEIPNATSTVLSSNQYFNAVTQASLQQHNGDIRLWYQTQQTQNDIKSYTLCYSSLTWDTFKSSPQSVAVSNTISVTPMTSEVQGDYVSLVAPPADALHQQHFMYLDPKQQFKLASQSVSGAWNVSQSSFSFPLPERITSLKSYTTNISYTDPVSRTDNHKLSLTFSDTASPYINGIKYRCGLSSPPLPIEVAPNGKLIIVHEPTNLVVPIITIQESNVDPIVIDPTAATQQTLSTLNTVKNLKTTPVKTEQGGTVTPLSGSKNVQESDIIRAAQNFDGLRLRAADLQNSKPVAVRAEVQSSGVTDHVGVFDDVVDGIWHFLEEAGEKVITWGTEAGKAIENFTVNLADGIRTVAVNTIHDIVRVAHIILKGLEIAWDIIKALVGALFDWKDIMATQQVIHANLSKAVQYGKIVFNGAMQGIYTMVNNEFADLQAMLDNLDNLSLGSADGLVTNLTKQTVPDSVGTKFGSTSKGSMVTGAITHGNQARAQGSPAVTPTPSIQSLIKRIDGMKSTWLSDPDMVSKLQQLGQSVADLPKNGPSIAGLITIFKNLLSILIEFVKEVTDEILNLVELIVDEIFSSLDAPIEIPILGPLIQWVAKNILHIDFEPPSALGIISFILAIIKCETDAVSSLPLDFDLASCFPPDDQVAAGAKSFFAGLVTPPTQQAQSAATSVSHSTTRTKSTKALVTTAQAAGTDDDQNWKKYSLTCSIVHPLVSAMRFALTGPLDSAIYLSDTLKISTSAPIAEKIMIAIGFADLAFSCPANTVDMRPSISYSLAGYAIGGYCWLCWGLGAQFESVEADSIGSQSILACLTIVKLSLMTKGIAAQIQSDDWHNDQKDVPDLKAAIGSITCEYAGATATWCLAGLGPYLTDKGNEAGPIIAAAGVIVDFLANGADFGVDLSRGMNEVDAFQKQANKGVYFGN